MKQIITGLICVAAAVCAGCNSLFYYPSDKVYNETIDVLHEEGFIDSSSGNKLNYYYFPAENPKGIILYFHGNSRNINAHYKAFLWAVPQGYDLLLADYSGYGKSTGKAEREAINADAIAMLAFAADKKAQHGYKLVAVGQSLGGAVMLGGVGSFDERGQVDLMVADCTFKSYIDIGKDTVGRYCLPIGWFRWGVNDNCAPWKTFEKIKDIPIIVSHCREDATVPFEFGEDLFSSLQNKEKYFVELSCKHTAGYWKEPNQKSLLAMFDAILFGKKQQ